jgi:hypothetical protein
MRRIAGIHLRFEATTIATPVMQVMTVAAGLPVCALQVGCLRSLGLCALPRATAS